MPQDVDLSVLHISVRAELKSLPTELADKVAAYLVRAGELIDTDPEQALALAQAARRRAARLAITREAVGESAYAAGEWALALTEFRSLRRMTGAQSWLPLMADCERALGRPQAALKLAKEAEDVDLDADSQIEMKIVEAGARADLGQQAEGRRLLKTALAATPRTHRFKPARARLGYAYADLLIEDGDVTDARTVFEQVRADDTEQLTDVAERLDELDGLAIEFDESDEEEMTEEGELTEAPIEEDDEAETVAESDDFEPTPDRAVGQSDDLEADHPETAESAADLPESDQPEPDQPEPDQPEAVEREPGVEAVIPPADEDQELPESADTPDESGGRVAEAPPSKGDE